jgi:cysteine desulfurase
MKPIYLDNNATTRCDPAVVEAMLPFFTEHFGNASSIHSLRQRGRQGAEEGARPGAGAAWRRARLGDHLHLLRHRVRFDCHPLGAQGAAGAQHGDHHRGRASGDPDAVRWLEKEGYIVHKLKVDKKGRIDLDEYKSLLNDRVAIVSAMWANNETGTIFPVEEMAELASAKGIMFHTDAVQAVGKMPIDLKNTKIDMLSLSGHKLHAPKGIGVLYLRRGCRFRPLLRGGHQERGRRAGTENSASIVGLGVACELAMQHMAENTTVKRLRDKLERGILSQMTHCFPTGDRDQPPAQHQQHRLRIHRGRGHPAAAEQAGHRRSSSGSACTSGSLEPSHVMRAMGIPYTAAHGTIRFSLSRYNTEEEVDRVIAAVPPIIAQLRKLSPYWSGDGPVANPGAGFPARVRLTGRGRRNAGMAAAERSSGSASRRPGARSLPARCHPGRARGIADGESNRGIRRCDLRRIRPSGTGHPHCW